MNSSIYLYHLFDVADEINLNLVEALWTSRNKIASRLRLEKVSPQSITFKDPPVLVELGSHELTLAGQEYLTEVKARIFDIGVVSLIFHLDVPEDITYTQYRDLAIALGALPKEDVREFIDGVTDTIKPACTKMRISEFDEDFVAYYFRDPLPDWDWAPLIMKEKASLSQETRDHALANRFSYGPDDVVYLTWDTALLYDKTGSMDLPDLLEFANAQFLELRYYDAALNRAIDQTYAEIDGASRPEGPGRLRTFRQLRRHLLEVMADMSVLTGNVDNALRVTEDIFNARVYSRYMYLLHTSVWRENINNKINVLQRCYSLLNSEILMHRFTQLGMVGIGLLAVIVILLLLIFLF